MNFFLYILIFVIGLIIGFYYNRNKQKAGGERIQIKPEESVGSMNTDSIQQKQDAETTKTTETLKKAVDNLYIVNELGQRVTSSLNLQQTFQHLYTTINSMMDAAVLELSVYNESSKDPKLFTNLPQPDGIKEGLYHNHLAEWCFNNNREVFLTDAENDYERYVSKPLTMPDGRIVKSLMAFPILNRELISGTLCIISFQKNMFDEYHRKIIRLLLGYISVAMQNAITHEELNVTKQRAERSEKFMQQFLANMSHEIRTPIHAVTGMTRLLLEKDPRQEQLRYLESIRNASDSLLVIINDILDLSKIEAGKIEFEQIDFSVFDVMENVKEIMQFRAEEKGLFLETQNDEKIPSVLIGDSTRLTQILINLVGNAVKFTEKGSVKLSVDSLAIASDNSLSPSTWLLRFTISDTGIGMTSEQQERLFQNYSQASTDTTRKYGGTGLGLSISKQLVQLQDGRIEVNSVHGKGSTFSFSLSYPVSKNKTVARKEKVISKEMLEQMKGIKILLADDNEYNRIVVKETLQLKIENVFVDEAMDGAMAVQLARDNEYDVVIMDLVMPKMNGLEATHEIRNRLPVPKNQLKIIALTASVVKSEIDKCFASGMNGFIPKPFKSYELLGVIHQVLYHNKDVTFELPELKDGTPRQPGVLIDLKSLQDFSEGDQERLQRLVDLFLTKIPLSIAALKSALEGNDYDKIRITSHSMKPQLHAAGVLQGLEIAENIERNCTEKINLDQLPVLITQLNGICNSAMEELKILNITR